MTAFLTWVYNQAEKVYTWFSDRFWSLYNAALNAWDWAMDWAAWALDAAKDWTWGIIREVYYDLTSLYDWVSYRFNNLANYIIPLVEQAIGSVIGWLNNQIAWLTDRLDSLTDWVSLTVSKVKTDLIAFFNSLMAGFRSDILSAWGWLTAIKTQLLGLIAAFTPDLIPSIVNFIKSYYALTVQFFTNPVKFIYDLVSASVVAFLSYLVAKGLGSVKYELPKPPSWS